MKAQIFSSLQLGRINIFFVTLYIHISCQDSLYTMWHKLQLLTLKFSPLAPEMTQGYLSSTYNIY